MMIEWGGWSFDEVARRFHAPVEMSLTRAEARFVATLLRAEGRPVRHRDLVGDVGKVEEDPLNASRVYASRLRFKLADYGVVLTTTVFGLGYSAVRATRPELAPGELERRSKVVAILVEQFEATGPHARAVASMIGEVYG